MFIEATKILKVPVAAEDVQAKIGEVKNIIIDPENGNFIGLIVKSGIFSKVKILSTQDILDWDQNGIVTSTIDNLVLKEEIIKIDEIIRKNIFLLGIGAKLESGKSLGKVEDLLIDTDNLCVAKYYLKDYLGKDRVLPSDRVIKIDKEIIFRDDTGEIPTEAVGATA